MTINYVLTTDNRNYIVGVFCSVVAAADFIFSSESPWEFLDTDSGKLNGGIFLRAYPEGGGDGEFCTGELQDETKRRVRAAWVEKSATPEPYVYLLYEAGQQKCVFRSIPEAVARLLALGVRDLKQAEMTLHRVPLDCPSALAFSPNVTYELSLALKEAQ